MAEPPKRRRRLHAGCDLLTGSGALLDVLGAVLIWVALRLLCPLFGVL
jgi:hypothetical protein